MYESQETLTILISNEYIQEIEDNIGILTHNSFSSENGANLVYYFVYSFALLCIRIHYDFPQVAADNPGFYGHALYDVQRLIPEIRSIRQSTDSAGLKA